MVPQDRENPYYTHVSNRDLGSVVFLAVYVVGAAMGTRILIAASSLFLFSAAHASQAGLPISLQNSYGPMSSDGKRSLHVRVAGGPNCEGLRMRLRGVRGAVPQNTDWHDLPCSGPLATLQTLVTLPPNSYVSADIIIKYKGREVVDTKQFYPPDHRKPKLDPPQLGPKEYSTCRNVAPVVTQPSFADSADMYNSIANGTFHTRLGGAEAEEAFWGVLKDMGATTSGAVDMETLVRLSYCLVDDNARQVFLNLHNNKLQEQTTIHSSYLDFVRVSGQQ